MEAEPIKAEPVKRKRRWFQFSLRTLMIGVTVVAVIAVVIFAVTSRIAHEKRIKDITDSLNLGRPPPLSQDDSPIIGKWIYDYAGHKDGYSAKFYPDGQIWLSINLPRPPLDGVGGRYSFNPADKSIVCTVWVDTGGRDMEKRTHRGHLVDDGTLILFEELGSKGTFRLKRDNIGVW